MTVGLGMIAGGEVGDGIVITVGVAVSGGTAVGRVGSGQRPPQAPR